MFNRVAAKGGVPSAALSGGTLPLLNSWDSRGEERSRSLSRSLGSIGVGHRDTSAARGTVSRMAVGQPT